MDNREDGAPDASGEDIVERTARSRKTYSFQDGGNPRLPAQHWFQHPTEGYTLFLVFYTQACRWAQCVGCNLPSLMSPRPIGFRDLMRQTDFVFEHLLSCDDRANLRKIIVSNNGSVLDQETFSTTALLYFIARMNMECPNIAMLTLETRAEYVDAAELEVIARALREGDTPTGLEVAVGFEAFDETIRNRYFRKGLSLEVFERLAALVGRHGFCLKVYLMQKPVPEMTDREAIEDVRAAIDYLSEVASRYGIRMNMHLNPTYVASGTGLADAFEAGRFAPPLLRDVIEAVRHAQGKNLSVFVGLNDEGLAVPGGSFVRPGDEPLCEIIEQFNRSQDYTLLPG